MCYLIYQILKMYTLVYFLKNSIDNCKKLSLECKGQTYKTAEIILLCHKFLYCDL